MIIPNSLTINGKTFTRSSAHKNGITKPSAEKIKQRLKDQGLLVRVVEYGRKYYVYSCRP